MDSWDTPGLASISDLNQSESRAVNHEENENNELISQDSSNVSVPSQDQSIQSDESNLVEEKGQARDSHVEGAGYLSQPGLVDSQQVSGRAGHSTDSESQEQVLDETRNEQLSQLEGGGVEGGEQFSQLGGGELGFRQDRADQAENFDNQSESEKLSQLKEEGGGEQLSQLEGGAEGFRQDETSHDQSEAELSQVRTKQSPDWENVFGDDLDIFEQADRGRHVKTANYDSEWKLFLNWIEKQGKRWGVRPDDMLENKLSSAGLDYLIAEYLSNRHNISAYKKVEQNSKID